jgi:hypothetical protein
VTARGGICRLRLAKDKYIPAGAIILAWQEELCRPREGVVKPNASKDFWWPVYYKKTNGWVNAYYLAPCGIGRSVKKEERDGWPLARLLRPGGKRARDYCAA